MFLSFLKVNFTVNSTVQTVGRKVEIFVSDNKIRMVPGFFFSVPVQTDRPTHICVKQHIFRLPCDRTHLLYKQHKKFYYFSHRALEYKNFL